MHKLILYTSKDEPKKEYWISKEEAASIAEQISNKHQFISLPRLGKEINIREIREYGIPDFILDMTNLGYEINFTKFSGTPYIQVEDGYMRYENGEWGQKIETQGKVEGQTFDEMIGGIKRLN